MNKIISLLKRPFVQDTLTTSLLVIFGKSIGFIVTFFIANWFGADIIVDSFFLAYSIIIFLTGIFGTTMSRVIVPYILELKQTKEDIGKFISSILILSCIIYFVILVTGIFLVKEIFRITTQFDKESLNRISLIIFEMIPFVILLICANTLDGLLNALKKFKIPAITPAFRSLIIILFIFLFKDSLGIHSIVIGYIAGELLRFIILIVIINRKGLIKFYFSITINKNLMDFLKKGLYQIIAMVMGGINPLVDKAMASWKGTGSVSILYYADRFYLIPVLFLVSGFLVTLLSYMSGNLYLENKSKFKHLLHKAVKAAGIAALIIMIPGIFLYKSFIHFTLGLGKLEVDTIIGIQSVFFGYFIGLLPYIISQVYGYALIVIKQTKALMVISLITCIFNIVCNYILMHFFGLTGLSLSTTIIRILNCIAYIIWFYFYYNKLGETTQ